MRLICPNCEAQYEIRDDVIPEDGRDVQCSNCGHTWFQASASAALETELDDDPVSEEADLHPPVEQSEPEQDEDPDTVSEAEAEPEPEVYDDDGLEDEPATNANTDARPLSKDIQSILQDEVAFEKTARKSEADVLEYQQDLGLSGAADESQREAQSRERMARLRGLDPEDPETTPEPPEEPTRKELLPDVDDINSTLRGGLENASVPLSNIVEDPIEPQRRGFRRGFAIALLIAAILALLYVYAPAISRAVPAISGLIEGYAAQVDVLRIGIDTLLKSAVESMSGTEG